MRTARQVRIALRGHIRKLSDTRADLTAEQIAALEAIIDAHDTELQEVEETEERAAADRFDNRPPERREFQAMIDGADVGAVVRFVGMSGHAPDGALAELQKAHNRGSNFIPPEIQTPWAGRAHDPVKHGDYDVRAAATFTADTEPGNENQVTQEAVAPPTLVEFMGGRIVNVGAGAQVFPVISTGATFAYPAASAAAAETTAAFTVHQLTAKRAQTNFALQREDMATFAGAAAALRENLAIKGRDAMVNQVLRRASDGLLVVGTAPTNPTAASTYAAYLAAMYAVDGLHAQAITDMAMVVGTDIYAHMGAVASTAGLNAHQGIQGSRGARVSNHVPDYASNRQEAVVCRTGLRPSNLVVANWGMELFEDVSSRAAEGEVRLYGVQLHDFAVLRPSAFVRHRFRNS